MLKKMLHMNENKGLSLGSTFRKGEALGFYQGQLVVAPFDGIITRVAYGMNNVPDSFSLKRTFFLNV